MWLMLFFFQVQGRANRHHQNAGTQFIFFAVFSNSLANFTATFETHNTLIMKVRGNTNELESHTHKMEMNKRSVYRKRLQHNYLRVRKPEKKNWKICNKRSMTDKLLNVSSKRIYTNKNVRLL